MTDELKQWEYDKGYEKGKADTLKAINAEIESIDTVKELDDNSHMIIIKSPQMIKDEVLEIINKYKAEIKNSMPNETVTEFADRCKECGSKYGKLLMKGHCKDCKYFEYDSVAKIYKIPVIVAHEICSRWGDGCKTKEDGYCFLFEPQESEE